MSSVSSHLWGRQAQRKHGDRSLDASQSDISANTLAHRGLGAFDDEFVGELESVYSTFADLSMGPPGSAVRLSTVFGTDDTMSDMESMTDSHLHSVPVRIPAPKSLDGRCVIPLALPHSSPLHSTR